jgi:hypothetical protein
MLQGRKLQMNTYYWVAIGWIQYCVTSIFTPHPVAPLLELYRECTYSFEGICFVLPCSRKTMTSNAQTLHGHKQITIGTSKDSKTFYGKFYGHD